MDRKTRWRTFWLALLTVLALCVLIPSFVSPDRLPRWFDKLFTKRIQLGLDLQGGFYVVYSLDLDKAVDDKASDLKRDIEAKMAETLPEPIKGRATTPATPVGAVNVIVDDPEDLKRIDDAFLADYGEYVETRPCPEGLQDRARCLRVSTDYAEGIRQSALEQAILTIRKRINARGVAEPSVKRKGNQVIVELPGLDRQAIQEVKDLIASTAKLEFKMVEDGSEYMKKLAGFVETDEVAKERGVTTDAEVWTHEKEGQFTDWYLRAESYTVTLTVDEAKERGCLSRTQRLNQPTVKCEITGRQVITEYLEDLYQRKPDLVIDDDHMISFELVEPRSVSEDKERRSFWRTYYLRRAVELSGSAITTANQSWDPQSYQPVVLVDFDRYGKMRFGAMTTSNVGKKMAIILDDEVISAPTIQSAIIGGRTQITMGGGNNQEILKEAQDLVSGLRTGSLPAPLQEESSSEIGPLLGRDAVDKAKMSFLLGTALVIMIMVFVYRMGGLISIVSLSLNILYMMAILATFGATLTLPGIAALVLTVGMAVDANIIIFERIREELRSGKSIRGAVDAGFSRGFAAIFDGQLTTGIAGYVLMQYGSGPIRGFAVMLIIGIICTLFTATWCTRLFFEFYVGKGRKVSQISI
jgi:preprotein translocase subunit SecD